MVVTQSSPVKPKVTWEKLPEQEPQRAERLAEYLRSQGINPDDI